MADETVLVEFKVDATGAIKGVRQFRDETEKIPAASKRAGSALDDFEKKLLKIAGGVLTVATLKKVIGGIYDLGASAIETGAKFERLGVQMKAVMGSVEGGKAAVDWVTQFTASTPYQLEQVSQAFVKLKAFGINPTTGALQAIADQTAVLGGDMEVMNTIILAVGKAFSKGKIEAEEWNMMAEKGVRVSALFADALGVSEAKVIEMRSAGKLGREEIEKFLAAMGGATAGASIEFMDTFTGKWSNLQDVATIALNEIASNGALDVLTEAMGGLIEDMQGAIDSGLFAAFGRAFADGLSVAADALDIVVEGVELFVAGLAGITSLVQDARLGDVVDDLAALEARQEGVYSKWKAIADIAPSERTWLQTKELSSYAKELGRIEIEIGKLTGEQADLVDSSSRWNDLLEKLQERHAGLNDGLDEQNKILPELVDNTTKQNDALGDQEAIYKRLMPALDILVAQGYRMRDAAEAARAAAVDATPELAKFNYEIQTAALGYPPDAPPPIDPFKQIAEDWKRTLEDMRTQVFTQLGSVFVDIITGQTDDIGGAMSGIADTIAQMFGNQLSAAIGQGLDNQRAGGEGGFGAGFTEGSGIDSLIGLGGAALVSYGQRSGGTGGVLAGAIGGALQAGAMSGWSPYAIVAGAIAGAAMSYFGGGEKLDPHVFLNYNEGRGGFGLDYQVGGDIEWSPAGQREWLRNLNTVFRESFGAYRDTLQTLALATGDVGLMRGSFNIENFDFGRLEGTPEEIARYISNEWLPAALDEAFGAAFREGLGKLGVGDDTLAALFSELSDLGMEERLDGLNTFIRAIASAYDLMDEMDWGTMMQRVGEDSMTTLMRGLGDIMEQVQVYGAGWDSLSLLEQAEELDQINQLVAQAREAEIQMLRQIDQLQKSINRSLDQQIEGLRTGGMTDAERQAYYLDQINSIMANLRAGIYSSPEALQMAMGDLQSYVSNYASAVGQDLYSASPGNQVADMLIGILEEARGLSDTALDGMRDQIQEANQALIDELARLTDALVTYGTGMFDDRNSPIPPGGRNQFDINIRLEPNGMFDAYVTNVVQREVGKSGYAGPY